MHDSSLLHDIGPHPEQPARITAIREALEAAEMPEYKVRDSTPASRAQLEGVHPAEHVDTIEALCASGGGSIDADTAVNRHSHLAATHAAGGACQLVDDLLTGAAAFGASLHRPPGHHAETDRAMGFCLYDSVAVAAKHALVEHGLERVLIVDWDVHHGNGTEEIFFGTDEVLFASIHQAPLYPGTGRRSDVGSGPGEGFTLNMPVPAGSGDAEFVSLVAHVVVPRARIYKPGLILISAGFDAHADDPLANCEVTEQGFADMASHLRCLGEELGVPVGLVLEGGYDLNALGRSTVAALAALAETGAPAPETAIADLSRRYAAGA